MKFAKTDIKSVINTIRKEFSENDIKRDENFSTPDDVNRYDNIHYGENPLQVLDVYCPKNNFLCSDQKSDSAHKNDNKSKLPVIVNIHGGAWVYGTKEVYQFYCMSLAQQGFAVVNFSYRLAPEHKFPSSIEDINTVCHWIFNNAEIYNFDTSNIFAVGDSAGAHQLSLYSCILTNKNYASQFDFKTPDFVFNAIALNCGKYDFFFDPEPNQEMIMKAYLPGKNFKSELKFINVVNYITENFPPAFVMTCTHDFLKKQSVVLSQKLIEKNVPFNFYFYKGNEQDLYHVFHCNIALPEALECNTAELNFFNKYKI